MAAEKFEQLRSLGRNVRLRIDENFAKVDFSQIWETLFGSYVSDQTSPSNKKT